MSWGIGGLNDPDNHTYLLTANGKNTYWGVYTSFGRFFCGGSINQMRDCEDNLYQCHSGLMINYFLIATMTVLCIVTGMMLYFSFCKT